MPRSNGSTADTVDSRLDRLEREMIREDLLEMATIRRLHHGLSDTTADADPVAKVDTIIERIDQLETEVQHL